MIHGGTYTHTNRLFIGHPHGTKIAKPSGTTTRRTEIIFHGKLLWTTTKRPQIMEFGCRHTNEPNGRIEQAYGTKYKNTQKKRLIKNLIFWFFFAQLLLTARPIMMVVAVVAYNAAPILPNCTIEARLNLILFVRSFSLSFSWINRFMMTFILRCTLSRTESEISYMCKRRVTQPAGIVETTRHSPMGAKH